MMGCHGGDDIKRGEVNKRSEEEIGEEEETGMKISGIQRLIRE